MSITITTAGGHIAEFETTDDAVRFCHRLHMEDTIPTPPRYVAVLPVRVGEAVAVAPPSILAEFALEEARAHDLFPGEDRLPNGTGGGGRTTWMNLARQACDRAQREGRLTHAHVFDEETAEVLAAETDEEIRKELVQVGAMTLKWIRDIDARSAANDPPQPGSPAVPAGTAGGTQGPEGTEQAATSVTREAPAPAPAVDPLTTGDRAVACLMKIVEIVNTPDAQTLGEDDIAVTFTHDHGGCALTVSVGGEGCHGHIGGRTRMIDRDDLVARLYDFLFRCDCPERRSALTKGAAKDSESILGERTGAASLGTNDPREGAVPGNASGATDQEPAGRRDLRASQGTEASPQGEVGRSADGGATVAAPQAEVACTICNQRPCHWSCAKQTMPAPLNPAPEVQPATNVCPECRADLSGPCARCSGRGPIEPTAVPEGQQGEPGCRGAQCQDGTCRKCRDVPESTWTAWKAGKLAEGQRGDAFEEAADFEQTPEEAAEELAADGVDVPAFLKRATAAVAHARDQCAECESLRLQIAAMGKTLDRALADAAHWHGRYRGQQGEAKACKAPAWCGTEDVPAPPFRQQSVWWNALPDKRGFCSKECRDASATSPPTAPAKVSEAGKVLLSERMRERTRIYPAPIATTWQEQCEMVAEVAALEAELAKAKRERIGNVRLLDEAQAERDAARTEVEQMKAKLAEFKRQADHNMREIGRAEDRLASTTQAWAEANERANANGDLAIANLRTADAREAAMRAEFERKYAELRKQAEREVGAALETGRGMRAAAAHVARGWMHPHGAGSEDCQWCIASRQIAEAIERLPLSTGEAQPGDTREGWRKRYIDLAAAQPDAIKAAVTAERERCLAWTSHPGMATRDAVFGILSGANAPGTVPKGGG